MDFPNRSSNILVITFRTVRYQVNMKLMNQLFLCHQCTAGRTFIIFCHCSCITTTCQPFFFFTLSRYYFKRRFITSGGTNRPFYDTPFRYLLSDNLLICNTSVFLSNISVTVKSSFIKILI